MGFMLMPSEIARLVYGYIDETEGCKDVARQYLETCPNLREFSEGIRRGVRYSSKINNMTLIDYLNYSQDCMENRENQSGNTSAKSIGESTLNQESLISAISNVIAKQLESVNDRQLEQQDRSFQKLADEREDFKTFLVKVLQNDFIDKIRDLVKLLENNLKEAWSEQVKFKPPASLEELLMKTPNNKHPRHSVHFSPAAHSSLVNSPRRKNITPRRLHSNPSSSVHKSPAPSNSSAQSPYITDPASQYSNYSEAYSSPGCTDSSELDIQALIDPPAIINRLIQSATNDERFSEKLANSINIGIQSLNPTALNGITEALTTSCNTGLDFNLATSQNLPENLFESHLVGPQQLPELTHLTTNAMSVEIDQFVQSVIGSTPFKDFRTSPNSTPKAASLNTPNLFPDPDNNSNKENGDNNYLDILFPVKNLMKDFATPHKGQHHPTSTLAKETFSGCANYSQSSNYSVSTQNSLHIASSPNSQLQPDSQNSQHNSTISDASSTSTLTNVSVSDSKPSQAENKIVPAQLNSSNIYLNQNSNVDSAQQQNKPRTTTTRPVFQDQHLQSKPRLKRSVFASGLQANQKDLRLSRNYAGPTEVRFGDSISSSHKESNKSLNKGKPTLTKANSSRQSLTTTIDRIEESNEKGANAVHSIESSSIQISNSQVLSSTQQNNDVTLVQQQQQQQSSDQFYYTTTPAQYLQLPYLDMNSGVNTTTANSVILVPSGDGTYTLSSITPQISTTSQNVYFRVVNSGDEAGNLSGGSILADSHNVPILPKPDTNPMPDQTIVLDVASPKKAKTNNVTRSMPAKPSILSKSIASKKKQLLESPQAINESDTTSVAKTRKEPRKSNLGKRITSDDEELTEPTAKRKREDSNKEGSRNSSKSRKSDEVETLLSSNINDFLSKVHQTNDKKERSIEKPIANNKRPSTAGGKGKKEKEKSKSKEK